MLIVRFYQLLRTIRISRDHLWSVYTCRQQPKPWFGWLWLRTCHC